jgi:hypothetical protein
VGKFLAMPRAWVLKKMPSASKSVSKQILFAVHYTQPFGQYKHAVICNNVICRLTFTRFLSASYSKDS